MAEPTTPWLVLIGLGEDGLAGLADRARAALDAAEVVFGGPRHLALADVGPRGRPWPVPFDLAPVLALRGQPVAVLASGDPFWHGVGGSLAAGIAPGEWVCHPGASAPSLAAARLGWRLEEVTAVGLHAAPFSRLTPHLQNGARVIATLRDGPAAADLAQWLTGEGFGASDYHVLERLGGPFERCRTSTAAAFAATISGPFGAPVSAALHLRGQGLPRSAGLPEDAFAHDGQITKSAIRALTIAALAPRPGEHLWDIGAGSGSVSVEWCRAGGHATAIEARADRAANIRRNAERFGLGHCLALRDGPAPDALSGLARPDAVFVGGGMDEGLLAHLDRLAAGCRLVVNAVTLETEALLLRLQGERGGSLMRIDLAHSAPLGRMRGWTAQRPVVQWNVRL